MKWVLVFCLHHINERVAYDFYFCYSSHSSWPFRALIFSFLGGMAKLVNVMGFIGKNCMYNFKWLTKNDVVVIQGQCFFGIPMSEEAYVISRFLL